MTASAAFAAGVAEVVLRIAGVSYPNFYQPDAIRGWSARPGAQGWWTKEGHAFVRFTAAGLRDDRERPQEKRAGSFRIALLGDSCTEAVQVPFEATWGKLLERELAHCSALAAQGFRTIETLNFGVSGYSTAQELLTLRHESNRFNPDLVLLAFYAGNDVRNNQRSLEQDPQRPYFVLKSDAHDASDRLDLDDSFRQSSSYRLRTTGPARLLYALFNRSVLLQASKQAKSHVDGWVGTLKARRKEQGAAIQELGLDNAVYAPPSDAESGTDWREAWAVTEAMLAAMHSETSAQSRRFAMVSLTTPIQVDPDPAVRARFRKQLGVETLSYPDDRLGEIAAKRGFPYLALAPLLAPLAEREKVYLHGFPNTKPGEGHWNERGHKEAARALARWLCAVEAGRVRG